MPASFPFENRIRFAYNSKRVLQKTSNRGRRAHIKGLHFHDLRREFGSRLRETPGMSDHEVRDWLGHASITTTSRYLRSTPMRLAQALERMEAAAETVVDADDSPHLAAVR